MVNVLFDTNIYDRLAKDSATCELILCLTMSGAMRVFINRTVAEELYKSPFTGIPKLFPFKYVGNTVGRVGIACAGDSLGSGKVYDEHLGNSVKSKDALIADAASWYVDWLASEDSRLLKRAGQIDMRATPLNYEQFITRLKALPSESQ